jgi:hypothetical protein
MLESCKAVVTVLYLQMSSLFVYKWRNSGKHVEKAPVWLWIMWISMGMNLKYEEIPTQLVDNLYLFTENC